MSRNRVNEERKRDAQRRIDRKIDVLKEYKERGVPRGAFVPKNMKEFLEWSNAKLRVEKIGTPRTMTEKGAPHNLERIKLVRGLIDELNPKSISPSVYLNEGAEYKNIAENILTDWHVAQHTIGVLNEELEGVRQERDRLVERVRELERLLGQVRRNAGALLQFGATATFCIMTGPCEAWLL